MSSYIESLSTVLSEHKQALALLKRVHEGDDNVHVDIHSFLQQVKSRQEDRKVKQNQAESRREKRRTSGRRNSGAFEILPRVHDGADYGAEAIVLARKGDVRLVWRYGSKFWANQLEPSVYTPGDLKIHGEPGGRLGRYLTHNHREPNTPDCRLNKALIERYAMQIDEVFGPGAAEKIKALKQTVLFETEPQD